MVKKLTSRIKPFNFRLVKTTETLPAEMLDTTFRLYLQSELIKRCKKNPSYSIRAFARALGSDISTLSKILSGKRTVGRLTIERMGARLGLNPNQVAYFLKQNKTATAAETAATNKKSMGTGAEVADDYRQLTMDSFSIISDWYHFAILELMATSDFRDDRRWIARVLGIRVSEANAAIERLVRVGLIEILEDGTWKHLSDGRTSISPNYTTAAMRSMQKQILEKAIDALENIPFEVRDQSSIATAMNSKLLPEAQEKIKNFRRELAAFVRSEGPLDSVYQLSIAFYPLTQTDRKEKL